ncbi:hypothetical protein COO60DRAFT_1190960 [Scenedesmus sp. NREL 46B-D3]|nr:hypothetical protein COO60DRAFT_1190960 [Scenedesmus sp. NREL 46B-D3]
MTAARQPGMLAAVLLHTSAHTSAGAGSAAASGLAATLLRPLTTSKRHVSPARTHTPGSPNATAGRQQRPPSMQPWPSSASPAAGCELHSAAHNAKLARAARDKQLARVRLGDSKSLVAALVQSSAVPTAEDVANALQQQLNVLGLTGARFFARTDAAARPGSAGGNGSSGGGGGVLAVGEGVQLPLAGDAGGRLGVWQLAGCLTLRWQQHDGSSWCFWHCGWQRQACGGSRGRLPALAYRQS